MRTDFTLQSFRALAHSRGFSLIETLIALVVLSIGLLGIAALQVEGIRSGRSALMRTRAVFLAADMADRIKANREGADNYAADAGAVAVPDRACADTAANDAPADNGGCTAVQMAAYDVWMWKGALDAASASGLPNGSGEILLDAATNPPTHTVIIRWTERGDPKSYALAFQDDPQS